MKTPITLFCALALLVGCATPTGKLIENTQDKVSEQRERVAKVFEKVEEAKNVDVPHYRRVPGLWLSDRVVTSNSLDELPAAFQKRVVLRDRRALNVGDVAEFLRSKTGLNVILQGEQIGADSFQVDHVGTVQELLDSVTSRLAMTWEWRDEQLLIQQSAVKTFVVKQPGLIGVRSASGGSRADPWTDLVAAIRVISPQARLSLVRSANAITVADRPVNMARISDLLELAAQNADKQVLVHWQLVNVTARTGGEAGLNLNYIMQRSGGKFSLASPGSLAGTNAGMLSLASTAGKSNGSSAAIALLNEAGAVYVVGENVEAVRHNTRREFGLDREITYNSESTPGLASASTTSASVGIKKSVIKVGLKGAFGASVHDNEQLDLLFDISITVLDALRADTSAGYLLESPETSKRFAVSEEGVRIRHGNTYILSAENSQDLSFDRRGLLPGSAAILGGSERSTDKRTLWLLLVTPIITSRGV